MLQKGGTLKENCPSLSTYLTYEVTALGLKCQWKLPYCGILVLRREKGKCKLLAHNRRHFHCFGVLSLRCEDQTAKNLVAKIESTGHIKQEGLTELIPSSAFSQPSLECWIYYLFISQERFRRFLQSRAIF